MSKTPRIKTKYEEPKAGEWIQPIRKGYSMACCDCGLVHTLDFRIKDGRVQFRVFRNNRKTAAMRRDASGNLPSGERIRHASKKSLKIIQDACDKFAPALKRLARS